MARPLPLIPRGPRRKRAAPSRLIFTCPRVSPEYELGALRALIKPQDRAAILHRQPEQRWPTDAPAIVNSLLADLRRRVALHGDIHWPLEGNFFFLATFDPADLEAVKALAVAVSIRLPQIWFTLDRLYLHGGAFFRRQFGVKLKLVPATNVHLNRALRTALRGLL